MINRAAAAQPIRPGKILPPSHHCARITTVAAAGRRRYAALGRH